VTFAHVRRFVCAAAVAAFVAVAPRAASAQVPVVERTARSEVGVSGAFVGPVSFGRSVANYTRPDGGAFPVFTTENGVTAGRGVEAHVTVHVSRRLSVEGTAGWSRAKLRTTITGDIEGAEDATISETLSRLEGEGSLLWTIATRGSLSFFVRGGAGIMHEFAGDGVYGATGTIGNAGAGMKYWRRAGTGRGVGLRIEGRASVRTNGITIGASKTVIAPVISGGIMFGF
jgi:hypothetical protein